MPTQAGLLQVFATFSLFKGAAVVLLVSTRLFHWLLFCRSIFCGVFCAGVYNLWVPGTEVPRLRPMGVVVGLPIYCLRAVFFVFFLVYFCSLLNGLFPWCTSRRFVFLGLYYDDPGHSQRFFRLGFVSSFLHRLLGVFVGVLQERGLVLGSIRPNFRGCYGHRV